MVFLTRVVLVSALAIMVYGVYDPGGLDELVANLGEPPARHWASSGSDFPADPSTGLEATALGGKKDLPAEFAMMDIGQLRRARDEARSRYLELRQQPDRAMDPAAWNQSQQYYERMVLLDRALGRRLDLPDGGR